MTDATKHDVGKKMKELFKFSLDQFEEEGVVRFLRNTGERGHDLRALECLVIFLLSRGRYIEAVQFYDIIAARSALPDSMGKYYCNFEDYATDQLITFFSFVSFFYYYYLFFLLVSSTNRGRGGRISTLQTIIQPPSRQIQTEKGQN